MAVHAGGVLCRQLETAHLLHHRAMSGDLPPALPYSVNLVDIRYTYPRKSKVNLMHWTNAVNSVICLRTVKEVKGGQKDPQNEERG